MALIFNFYSILSFLSSLKKSDIREMALIVNFYSIFIFFVTICYSFFFSISFHLWRSEDGADSLIFILSFSFFLLLFSFIYTCKNIKNAHIDDILNTFNISLLKLQCIFIFKNIDITLH